MDPALILNNAIINSAPDDSQLNFELAIVQQLTSPNTGVLEGGNFNKNNPNSSIGNWRDYYRNVIRYTADVIERTSEDGGQSNLWNKARIIQANAFMIITDTYGSIPYDEGGKGYIEQIFSRVPESATRFMTISSMNCKVHRMDLTLESLATQMYFTMETSLNGKNLAIRCCCVRECV